MFCYYTICYRFVAKQTAGLGLQQINKLNTCTANPHWKQSKKFKSTKNPLLYWFTLICMKFDIHSTRLHIT